VYAEVPLIIGIRFLEKYAPRDIYNADESALYSNLLTDKSLAVKDGWPMRGWEGEQGTYDLPCALTWMGVIRLSHS
jgi:hypothetical protein